jgi:hypothetical protein
MSNRMASLCFLMFTLVACSTSKSKTEPGNTGPGSAGPGSTTPAAQTASDTGGAGNTPAPTGGVACGPKTCPAGQVCCNESCGICTDPGGFCTQQFCEPAGGCRQDGDCRVFSDYCTGCDCRVLGKDDKDPTCSGPGVRCLADPCQQKQAVCKNGQCALAAK